MANVARILRRSLPSAPHGHPEGAAGLSVCAMQPITSGRCTHSGAHGANRSHFIQSNNGTNAITWCCNSGRVGPSMTEDDQHSCRERKFQQKADTTCHDQHVWRVHRRDSTTQLRLVGLTLAFVMCCLRWSCGEHINFAGCRYRCCHPRHVVAYRRHLMTISSWSTNRVAWPRVPRVPCHP